jgi:hypothetical protein
MTNINQSPIAQRIGVFSLKQTLEFGNVRGLLVTSLIFGAGLVAANEFFVRVCVFIITTTTTIDYK